jgi:hypothetical protein
LKESAFSLEKMEAAMVWLAETDDDYARAKVNLLASEIMAKRVRARLFVAGEGSVEARKAAAEAHQEAETADQALVEATLAFEGLKARRQRAELVIDGARTLEASRRKS